MLVFVDTPFSTVNHTYQILLGKLSLTSRVAENCSYSLQMNLLHVWVLNDKQKHIIILTCWGLSISVVHWWPEEWDWCAQLMELSLICWRTLQLRQKIQMIQNNPSILPINMCTTHGAADNIRSAINYFDIWYFDVLAQSVTYTFYKSISWMKKIQYNLYIFKIKHLCIKYNL